MSATEHKLLISKTARFYTLGDITTARRIWFVFHGYGQLARYFVQNFIHLDLKENYIVAPEGLNKFYLNGYSGRVGATWMTKDDRLNEIYDYVNFVEEVYQNTIVPIQNEKLSIVALGFSQGVATLTRWIATKKHDIQTAVLWAGTFPPDLDPVQSRHAFSKLRTIYVLGQLDPFIALEQVERVKEHLKGLDIYPEWLHFDGAHEIPEATLGDLQKMLAR